MDKKIPKFIYIDDEEPQIVESFIHGLNDTGKIKVVRLDFSESKSMAVSYTHLTLPTIYSV